MFVRRRDDRPDYVAFDRYWRGRLELRPRGSRRRRGLDGGEPGGRSRGAEAGDERVDGADDRRGPCRPTTTSRPRTGDDAVIAPDAYSKLEALRHREFDRMTPAELRDAERLVDLLVPRLERRRTRRYELHPHGRRLAPRAMFRRNLGHRRESSLGLAAPRRAPRPLVVLCDISGSMERHSRLLLRFVQALAAASAVRTSRSCSGRG